MDHEYYTALSRMRNRPNQRYYNDGQDDRITVFDCIGFVLFVVWLLWAFCQMQQHPKTFSQASQDYEYQKKAGIRVAALCSKIGGRAHKLGRNYTPKTLYSDLREIDRLDQKLGFPTPICPNGGGIVSSSTRGALMEQCFRNTQDNREMEMQRWPEEMSYNSWKSKYNIGPKTGAETLGAHLKSVNWWTWSWFLFLRTWPVCLLMYALRIWKRKKRLLATVLADKKKFVFSILFWPYGLFCYPGNIIREIVVQTELRRIKDKLLAPLSRHEKKVIDEIAGSTGYKVWRKEYCHQNTGNFKHSFALALAATILCLFILPWFSSSAQASTEKEKTKVLISSRAGPIEAIWLSSGQQKQFETSQHGWITPPLKLESCSLVGRLANADQSALLPDIVNKIAHVPLPDYLVA
ncbi:TPA: hypothetical protein DD449_03930 [Candidatus Berkelbacteria bacterium]|uniref:Uncharacterized protein n=1 Tax=Berkelbacteria bacterium GW2011_GWE1_39_12 TaxID=1618337 RepID=A0A0G4B4B3_9BACT|nr:MAG: hypothetical protein UT28_C0001G0422 [Berkelbacteria bacterium GW2011_GWE1_39_12]HBO60806.1 hypothetical protein [Candidatus Berkelbacteria bacterium]